MTEAALPLAAALCVYEGNADEEFPLRAKPEGISGQTILRSTDVKEQT